MPRRGRVEYAGAVYHVMDRGNRSESIFLDDDDRRLFLKTLGQACERTGWRVHSHVLMGNHYHLLLETPEANLSVGMHWLQSTYTVRHNTRHRQRGHLFQGRYKAIPVEAEDGTYFQTTSDYIHLNPVRAGLLGEGKPLMDYPWSSFPALAGVPGKRPGWLCGDWVLNQGDTAGGRAVYRKAMEQRAAEERGGGAIDRELLASLRSGWFFGSETFGETLLQTWRKEGRSNMGRLHDEQEAKKIIERGLEVLGMKRGDLAEQRKGCAAKIAMAAAIRKRTVMTNAWIAEKLHMGDPSRVSRYCTEAEERSEVRKLLRKVEMSISKA